MIQALSNDFGPTNAFEVSCLLNVELLAVSKLDLSYGRVGGVELARDGGRCAVDCPAWINFSLSVEMVGVSPPS